ncbi:carbohydrate sulfotransferase 13-like isoform X2 [Pomacea canaliculata]|uniref:carbohydrate sulfotransferase 13-like isoform X2 n=1 Tax=Pomacea canaliculata TaxID=400727 RepID=UPI000D73933A|nr:carbohydrate sulfotransferase 13-like isoform X2 [Pomacea canaliculata]
MPRLLVCRLRHAPLVLLVLCLLVLLFTFQSDLREILHKPVLADVENLIWTDTEKRSAFKVDLHATSDMSDQHLTDEQVEDRFALRRAILQRACALYGNSSLFSDHEAKFLHVESLNVSFCPIAKCSSTTWKELFSTMRSRLPAAQSQVEWSQRVDEILMFVFVRNPYSRLLSAYVDKLFSPNTLFWAATGRYIVSNFRQNASEKSRACGHDVTFSEFIKYFIHAQTTGKHRDGHFTPVHDHCHVCKFPYKYVGHLETISDDLPYLLKVMKSPVNYTKNFVNGTITNNSDMVLRGMRAGVLKCMSLEEAGRRLWKKWHIRGIISKSQLFPLSAAQMTNMSVDDFARAAIAAIATSADRKVRQRQKLEALQEAFYTVPIEDKLEVQKLLFLDFQLFGFDPSPPEVFPSAPLKNRSAFSYFSLYD